MPDIFLSYAREDQTTARRFADALQREGFTVWWDQALHPGQTFDKVTETVLKEAKAVVVLWSKHAVDSRWVRSEAAQADRFGTLVPVTIESCDRPIMFELSHTADLSDWKGDTDDGRWRSFVESVKRQVGLGSASSSDTTTISVPIAARPIARRWLAWGGAAVAVLVAVAAWYLLSRPTDTAAAKGGASIAVMPFDDMSETKDQEYFADGVAEEILNTLARIPNLRVTARNSSFAFKGRKEDLRKVGQELGVANLLEGSIRKSGDHVRITAQLIKADDGFHLWTQTYDRPLTDIFAVQEDIARSVAEALQIKLGVGLGQAPGMTHNVDAYDAFLAANAVPAQFTRDTNRRRVELLQQAVAADPNFAWAWAGLSFAYSTQAAMGDSNAAEARRNSEAAFQQHVKLLPGSPVIPARAAIASMRQGRWIEAEQYGREARAAGAKLFRAVNNTQAAGQNDANFLITVGRISEALPLLEQIKSSDPLNQYVAFALGWAYGTIGNYPASFAELERGDHLVGPEQFRIRTSGTQIALGARDAQQLQRWLDAMIELETQTARFATQGERANFHGQMKALLDKPDKALASLLSVDRKTMPLPAALSGRAQWIAYFGDKDAALENLRVAFDRGVVDITAFSMWGPALHEVRKLPGFKQLMIDRGFVDYWRASGWGDFCKPVGESDFECN